MKFMEKEFIWGFILLLVVSSYMFMEALVYLDGNFSSSLEWIIMIHKGVSIEFILYKDWVSSLFFGVVSLISSSIMLYSGSYMKSDMNIRLFIFLVMLFILSMFFVVFSLNLISLLLGWDGLGLSSYLLIVYYQNSKSNSAGMLTMMSNRVGDAALLLCIACYIEYGGWGCLNSHGLSNFVSGLIVLAAITKSAQIPFSAWLPAAMAAPTPVSALVHSSTLVTAGVYLLVRFYPKLSNNSVFSILIYLGGLTAFMASVNALFETDLKKMVALSTLSQLGLMMSMLGLGLPELAFFHLLTHAVFKALLFMCSGKIIHNLSSTQDLRGMGSLSFNLPLTGMILSLSSLSLSGLPFLAGFYSKDLALEVALMSDLFLMKLILFMSMAGLSILYSLRFTFLCFLSVNKQHLCIMSVDEDWMMIYSKSILTLLSVVYGSMVYWWMAQIPWAISLPLSMKCLITASVLMGLFLGTWMMTWEMSTKSMMNWSYWSMESQMNLWYLNDLSSGNLVNFNSKLSKSLEMTNKTWFETLGGQGIFYWMSCYLNIEVSMQMTFFKRLMILLIIMVIWFSMWD